MMWEDPHARVAQSMKQIKGTDKKIGDTYKKEKMILVEPAGIPSDDKNRVGDNYRKYFNQAMKEKIALERKQI